MSELTKNYHREYKSSLASPTRVSFQARAVNALTQLFKDVINIPFQGQFLDIGCGDGSFIIALELTGKFQTQGIDIDSNVDFEKDKLPYEDNQFDFTLMYSVIEHIFNPNQILLENHRILKKGQYLIIITPNIDQCGSLFYNDPTHIRPYNPVGLEKLMKMYNFEKTFLGLWTVGKSSFFWQLSSKTQFRLGSLIPFAGNKEFIPSFLKGKSETMFGVFKKI